MSENLFGIYLIDSFIKKCMINVTHFIRHPHSATYSIERLYTDVRNNMPCDIQIKSCINRYLSAGLLRRVYDIIRVFFHQSNINHVTGDVHYLTYLLDKRQTILTIHDCEFLERSRGLKRFLLWLFWFWLPEKRVSSIVVVSEETKARLQKFIRCDAQKIKVIHNPVSAMFQPMPKIFNQKKPRLLQIGTKANKNIERLAEALSGLNIELVIVGKLSIQQSALLDRRKIQYENLVGLSDGELLEEYHRCDLLVFVSTYEGFGMPIVEAQAVGRAVVTSNLSSMPEIGGNAACYVDPFDIKSIRAGITKVIEDEEYRNQLIELGWKNVLQFRAEKIAEEYASLYRTIYTKQAVLSKRWRLT
jgi:glycosyltransferase involved in cell wall biosynthesis